MSKAINRYRADLRDVSFVLFEQFKMGDLLGKAPFDPWGPDEVNAVVKEAYRFSCEVTGPLAASADREGCRLERGRVIVPSGFKEAWGKLYEAGFKTLSLEPEHHGQGAPIMLQIVVEEMLSGSNTAFNMYPGLAFGAAELIQEFGTPAQKQVYIEKMLTGVWGGTMCLTEANAGSDVGASTSTAKRLPDGRYSIKGTKIFISCGDHDLAENIIHLVLARVEGAAPGTKGLSLFVVPKLKVQSDGRSDGPNDVSVGTIEHKMGINGSSTCVLNFGENGDCQGELVGTVEHQGMSQMFKMMNGARIAVGIQGLGLMSTAFLNAFEYSKERKQGASMERWKDATAPRVRIVEHADVRRSLLDMKARVEGIRALAVKLGNHIDQVKVSKLAGDSEKEKYHQGQIEVLTPIVKAYSSDQAFRVCETAIQVLGGVGYCKDFPVEQYCRDAKIFSIYEGTNHIQAMDLVGRKLGQAAGANFRAFDADVSAFVAKHQGDASLGAGVEKLDLARGALMFCTMKFMEWSTSGRLPMIPLAANRFLEMMGEVAVGWLLLEQAVIARDAQAKLEKTHPDWAFYEGKKYAALFFARNVLPTVPNKAELIMAEDTSPLDIPTEAFASI